MSGVTGSDGSLAHLFFYLNLLGQVWQPADDNNASNFKKCVGSGLSHPTRSRSRKGSRGHEGLIGGKGTVRPDFHAKTRPRVFLKS